MKANPNLELLKAVRGVADGLDISSGGELEQVMVTVGVTDEARSLVEIKSGLQLGDQVVVGNVGTPTAAVSMRSPSASPRR